MRYYNNTNKYNKMTIEGEGVVKTPPDIAVVTLGIVTEDKDLEKAQRENAFKTDKVIKALNGLGVSDRDIKTVGYFINPKYDYVEGERVFRGYEVVNRLEVTIRDLEKTGEIIDEAVKSGANVVGNIDFRLNNPSIYYRKALTLAVRDAVNKANDIARTLRVMVNSVPVKITEVEYKSFFAPKRPVYRSPEAITPIMPGQIQICARVKAVFVY